MVTVENLETREELKGEKVHGSKPIAQSFYTSVNSDCLPGSYNGSESTL